jgi:hypothetical protein
MIGRHAALLHPGERHRARQRSVLDPCGHALTLNDAVHLAAADTSDTVVHRGMGSHGASDDCNRVVRPDTATRSRERPRLRERLRRGAESRLTQVSAPAGFGKTSLTNRVMAQVGSP